MIKNLLLIALLPLSSLAMEDAYKIVLVHHADNKPYIVKIYDRSKREQPPILDREMQKGSDLQKVMEEAKNITVGVYENTPQGPKPLASENFDLPGMNLPYTNLKEKLRGFILNIVKDPKTGKIQLVKDFETLVKEAGLQPQAAAAPSTAQTPMWKQDKYSVAILNQADNPYTIKIFNRANKQLVFEKEMQPDGEITTQIPILTTPITEIAVGVYEKTDQGLKAVTAENINLPDLKLVEFNPVNFPTEKGFAIIISKKNGQLQLTKDLEYAVRGWGKKAPQPAPATVPAPQVKQPIVAPASGKYELDAFNGHLQQVRIELITKAGKELVNKSLPVNARDKWELDASVFPLVLKAYDWRNGREVKVFEDEIDMPAFNLPKLQFYFNFDNDLRLKFIPTVPHGRQKAPIQSK